MLLTEQKLSKREIDFLSDLMGVMKKHNVCIDTDADPMRIQFGRDWENRLYIDNYIDVECVEEILYREKNE